MISNQQIIHAVHAAAKLGASFPIITIIDTSTMIPHYLFFRIYVWNPNEANRGSEIVGEFPSYNQWSFDLDWCKHDPSLVAVSSVDGCVSVYSLLGGGLPPAQSDKVCSCVLLLKYYTWRKLLFYSLKISVLHGSNTNMYRSHCRKFSCF